MILIKFVRTNFNGLRKIKGFFFFLNRYYAFSLKLTVCRCQKRGSDTTVVCKDFLGRLESLTTAVFHPKK